MAVTLLSRDQCSACLTAAGELRRICAELGEPLEIVDVDAAAGNGQPQLRAEFGDRLPVILLDGEEHGYWEVSEARLRADIAARDAH